MKFTAYLLKHNINLKNRTYDIIAKKCIISKKTSPNNIYKLIIFKKFYLSFFFYYKCNKYNDFSRINITEY